METTTVRCPRWLSCQQVADFGLELWEEASEGKANQSEVDFGKIMAWLHREYRTSFWDVPLYQVRAAAEALTAETKQEVPLLDFLVSMKEMGADIEGFT